MAELEKEICSIRVMFPVDSDEQAIDIKKKLKDVLSPMPDATFDFRIIGGRLPVSKV